MTLSLHLHPTAELGQLVARLSARFEQIKAHQLELDLTRGKPSAAQLDLSNALDGILNGDFRTSDGGDARNYGGLRGIPEARALGAEIMGTRPEWVMAGGNSSLTLMYQVVETALRHGLWGGDSAWQHEVERHGARVKFLCPVPGYDRHFTVCETLGIDMIPVPIGPDGPDLAELEAQVSADPMIKGLWCVPKHSNPTGCVYSENVVRGIAELPRRAGRHFLVLWDNAYAVHDLDPPGPAIPDLLALAEDAGTAEHVVMFASTSKITFAGAGIAFVAAVERVMCALEQRLGAQTIGPDKVNQLRHARFLTGRIEAHMRAHAELIRPKFETVMTQLRESLSELDIATWTEPCGGYFISLDTLPGLAREVIKLAGEAGVTLTPAGATFPYGRDPEDRNIRIAPTFLPPADIEAAMEVFTLCVQLASARKLLAERRDHS